MRTGSDEPCQSCGRKGLPLVGIDFKDQQDELFRVCVRCASAAVDHGCSMHELEEGA